MPSRNRVIYQSEGLFVSDDVGSISETDQTLSVDSQLIQWTP